MIICAGLNKTGTKSCSAALRKLGQNIQMYTKQQCLSATTTDLITFYIHSAGYNVADFMEATEFLSITWTEYFDGKIGIEKD